ncbi:MAG: hypothetical protein ACOZIN_11725 [Myxococcota bacterium]
MLTSERVAARSLVTASPPARLGSPPRVVASNPSPAKLRQLLLGPTLEHAATRVPYYRKRWGARPKQLRLTRLPFLTKDEAIAHQEELLAGERFAYVGAVSSGTMHGDQRPLRVLRTEVEKKALDDFLAMHERPPRARRHPGWVLEVRAMHHGIPLGPPFADRLRMPWTYTANALRLLEEMLSRPQADGRWVTSLVIGAGALMPFTAHLLERGVDPSRWKVRTIGTTGFRLSPHWRRLVAEVFDAAVLDNYSLSEFESPALECQRCGYNHWLPPPLYFEVVDAHTRQALERGTGVLVLTGLFPFAQAMPLVRYWTGDLVELGPRCAEGQDIGIRFRGRLSESLVLDGRVLVASQDVVDFLEGRPEVARHPHPMETLGLIRSPEAGAVKFEARLNEARRVIAHITVELRFDPKVFSSEAEAVGRGLARYLLSKSPILRRLERRKEGELQVHLTGPGGVTQRWSKF